LRRPTAAAALGALALALAGCGSGSGQSLPPSVMKPLRRAARSDRAFRAASASESRLVRVPRLVGMQFGEAVRVVHRAGLRQTEPGFSGSTSNPNLSGGRDRIVSQSPKPGTKVPRGSTVAIHEGVQSKLGGGRYAQPSG
jgi:PASTA domain